MMIDCEKCYYYGRCLIPKGPQFCINYIEPEDWIETYRNIAEEDDEQ